MSRTKDIAREALADVLEASKLLKKFGQYKGNVAVSIRQCH